MLDEQKRAWMDGEAFPIDSMQPAEDELILRSIGRPVQERGARTQ